MVPGTEAGSVSFGRLMMPGLFHHLRRAFAVAQVPRASRRPREE